MSHGFSEFICWHTTWVWNIPNTLDEPSTSHTPHTFYQVLRRSCSSTENRCWRFPCASKHIEAQPSVDRDHHPHPAPLDSPLPICGWYRVGEGRGGVRLLGTDPPDRSETWTLVLCSFEGNRGGQRAGTADNSEPERCVYQIVYKMKPAVFPLHVAAS